MLVALFDIFGIKICLILQLWKLNYELKSVVSLFSVLGLFYCKKSVATWSFNASENLDRFDRKKLHTQIWYKICCNSGKDFYKEAKKDHYILEVGRVADWRFFGHSFESSLICYTRATLQLGCKSSKTLNSNSSAIFNIKVHLYSETRTKLNSSTERGNC